jgi:hypothetical protein
MPAATSKSVRKTEPKPRTSSAKTSTSYGQSSTVVQDAESLPLPASLSNESTTPPPKPGRKTRGSKIVTKQQMNTTVTTPPLTNIILNLKCSMSDLKEYNDKLSKMISNPLEYNSSAPPEVKYYDGENKFGAFIQTEVSSTANKEIQSMKEDREEKQFSSFLSFSAEESAQDEVEIVESHARGVFGITPIKDAKQSEEPIYQYINTKIHCEVDDKKDAVDDVNMKDMSAKLKQLKIQLYKNTLHSEKKSACFWCTYDFDNAPCYIPKYEMDDTIYGYGSFCRPECAVAYLMKESIDDSTKFDRYQLLNQIYSKVYDCKKNIKPAPDPHYLLDKFYGNLNIQEYRRLLKTEHLLLVIDKPLTRILPELHEDTDDAFTKIYGIKATSGNSSGVYKVKRQSEQPNGPSKASIIKSTFGI